MIVINKSLHPHNSLGMINKVMQINKEAPPSIPETTKLPKTSDIIGYRKAYKNLRQIKRDYGLSYKMFKNQVEYVRALKEERSISDNVELRKFIKEQLTDGFAFDSECVFI